MKFPKVPRKYLNDFVRGYFDGDGCVYLEMAKGKKQKLIIKKLSVIFTSGSKIFLQELALILRLMLNLKGKKVYNSHRSYQLRYNTAESIQLFKFFYRGILKDFYFKRKFKIFLRYFKLRPFKINKDVRSILRHIGYNYDYTVRQRKK